MGALYPRSGEDASNKVFCLLRVEMLDSLVAFTQKGGRKIDAWTGQHRCAIVPFDRAEDAPEAFFNANTLEELQKLETL